MDDYGYMDRLSGADINCIHGTQATSSNDVALISPCVFLICTFNYVCIIKVARLLVLKARELVVLARKRSIPR